MRNSSAKVIALGGVLGAVALVILCLGGLIPLSTYVCPMLCCVLQFLVLKFCGRRIAWAWYGVVALLGLLLGPDKEAAAVFVLLGYYPILKPVFEKSRLSWLWKILLFNGAILVLYAALIHLLGLAAVTAEFTQLGTLGLVVLLLLGNLTFILLDIALSRFSRKMG